MDAALDDGRISQPESELLRAICAILECPLPPVIAAIWPKMRQPANVRTLR
jgi:tellurite resistance protein